MEVIDNAKRVIQAMGFEYGDRTKSSFAFSTKQSLSGWSAYSFETVSNIPIYHIITNDKNLKDLRVFLTGIKKSSYVILVTLNNQNVLFIRNSDLDVGAKTHIYTLKNNEDYNKIIATLRKYDIVRDSLTGNANLNFIVGDLFHSTVDYTNRGLFSNHYLDTRLIKDLKRKKRSIEQESNQVFTKIQSNKTDDDFYTNISLVLKTLGYNISKLNSKIYLKFDKSRSTVAILTKHDQFDVKHVDSVPSMEAVAALDESEWVILTNGKLWRMYSSKVSSASTNYFEINLDQIVDKNDARLQFFVAIFSARSRIPDSKGKSDLDLIHDSGIEYAEKLEQDMKEKIFKKDLFVKFVKSILDYSSKTKYTPEQLEQTKTMAIKLLYRLMFIMYAESRMLLPMDDDAYKRISLSSLRDRTTSFQKNTQSCQCWTNMQSLFQGIREGNTSANLPRYNGALFEFDPFLDNLKLKNEFLASALQDLTEKNGEKIDYQNLGVRHLGSIYEGLLEYDLRQAEKDIIITKNGTFIDAKFAGELKSKPAGHHLKNDIYLSTGGLAKKGTGSYFTPEPIVQHLVRGGLAPIFEQREKEFARVMKINAKNEHAKTRCNDIMLDLQILDPAMGSGHFLVTAADEVTKWIMRLVQKYPNSPIVDMIDIERERIIKEHNKSKIRINKDLLTSNTILKRMVIKRCIFGLDVNNLAAELTKLSLWLDSFTIGVPLTFFDHHIRNGNSLIGLRHIEQNINARLDDYVDKTIQQGNDIISAISKRSDTTLSEIKADQNDYIEFQNTIHSKKRDYDIKCAKFIHKEKSRIRDRLSDTAAVSLSKKYGAFHWELEFPEAFTSTQRGFSLVIGNPPWEAIKPSDDEFFSRYWEGFRALTNKSDKKKIKNKLLKNPDIKERFDDYLEDIRGQSRFYKESGQYVKRGSGDTDMWKLFLERMMSVVADGGVLSVVLPSGILTNAGATALRKAMLGMRIISMYEFENRKKIFSAVDSRFKFVLLTLQKVKPADTFHAIFYQHDYDVLTKQTDLPLLDISVELIKNISPESMAIPEFRTSEDVAILASVYGRHGRVRDGLDNGRYTIEFTREINRGGDSDLFQTDGQGWPMIEGKNMHQFAPYFTTPDFTIAKDDGLKQISTVKIYKNFHHQIHKSCQLIYRYVASSTNMRTMISCIVPPERFFADSTVVITLHDKFVPIFDRIYYNNILYLVALFNSFTFDYLIRIKTSMNLSLFIVKSIAIPTSTTADLAQKIIQYAAKLSLQSSEFSNMAESLSIPIKEFTNIEKIEIAAELDAMIAHHYGLTRNQYKHILSTFSFKNNKLDIETSLTNITHLHAFQNNVSQRALHYYDAISTSD